MDGLLLRGRAWWAGFHDLNCCDTSEAAKNELRQQLPGLYIV